MEDYSMKKFLAMIIITMMVMSLVGCGGSDDTSSKMEALVESASAELEGTESAGVEIDLSSDGNTLIYCYTMTDIDSVSYDLDLIREALDAQSDFVDAEMETALEVVKDEVDDSCTVLLQYMTSDGELISEKEYK